MSNLNVPPLAPSHQPTCSTAAVGKAFLGDVAHLLGTTSTRLSSAPPPRYDYVTSSRTSHQYCSRLSSILIDGSFCEHAYWQQSAPIGSPSDWFRQDRYEQSFLSARRADQQASLVIPLLYSSKSTEKWASSQGLWHSFQLSIAQADCKRTYYTSTSRTVPEL